MKPPHVKNQPESFEYCDAELVIGIVCAVGTDYGAVQAWMEGVLAGYGYKSRVIKISGLFRKLTNATLVDSPEVDRINSHMDAGNLVYRESGRKDIWALAAIAEINAARELEKESFVQKPIPRTAHILLSLKRPEEAATLRKVYGDGFFLVGVFATEKERLDNLINRNVAKQDALKLIKRDSEEADEYGQHTRDTFYLSDVFVRLRNRAYETELQRFFDLVFSNPYITPTPREHAMFLAYASSLRSGQLGRQVGAAITSRSGDVLAVGCNDVPKPGGGLYWPGPDDRRDHILGSDTNDRQRDGLVQQLLAKVAQGELSPSSSPAELRDSFRSILDITEYGRAVHAEMDALLTCARSGVSAVNGVLYTTTFPCHNCTRHIIAAGVERVVYIEPYAKSRAEELHEDAIIVEEKAGDEGLRARRKVPFTPFVGVGPRRYFDLFSLSLSRGHELTRKSSGRTMDISRQGAWVRVPMAPLSYIQREAIAIRELDNLPRQLGMFE
jgi:deoxycytidylate deaminase